MTRRFSAMCLWLVIILAGRVPALASAADDGAIRGVVRDPLGAVVSGAQLTLQRDGQDVKSATSGSDGAVSRSRDSLKVATRSPVPPLVLPRSPASQSLSAPVRA